MPVEVPGLMILEVLEVGRNVLGRVSGQDRRMAVQLKRIMEPPVLLGKATSDASGGLSQILKNGRRLALQEN
jgi:hypothetical protein